MTTVILMPVLWIKKLRGWPENAEGGEVRYLPLVEAMRRRWPTDAHTAQWCVPSIRRRLAGEAYLRIAVQMVVVFFDVDGAGHVGTDEWWAAERIKILDLFCDVQGFAYRTRGGYRLLFVLPVPIVVASEADAEAWSRLYRAWCRHLLRDYEISADHMIDWARLFRLPHATRDEGGLPEDLETIGDPRYIEAWAPELTADDMAVEPEPETPKITRGERKTTKRADSSEIQRAADRWLADHGAVSIELDDAADRWNADHATTYGKDLSQCPVCPAGHGKASFKRTPRDSRRWYCFSSNHPDRMGIKSKARVGHSGDPLDFDAYQRGLSRIEALRDDGYLDDALDVEAKKRGCGRVAVLLKDGYLRRETEVATAPDFRQRLERVTAAGAR